MFTDCLEVKFSYSNNHKVVTDTLYSLPTKCAYDFEVASKATKEDRSLAMFRVKYSKDFNKCIEAKQLLGGTGLSHPALTVITHLSVAWTGTDAFVAILDTKELRNIVYKYLVETDNVQIWHNILFDGKHILYHTGKYPKNIIDTKLKAKDFLNSAGKHKSGVGLKDLMGHKYGTWAIVEDNVFTLDNIYNLDLIKYAAIDAAATFCLNEDIDYTVEEYNKQK